MLPKNLRRYFRSFDTVPDPGMLPETPRYRFGGLYRMDLKKMEDEYYE